MILRWWLLAAVAIAVVWLTLPQEDSPSPHEESRTFSVLGFIRIAPALCVGILFFAFFDSVVLSLFPVYAATHGYSIKLAALMVTIILLGDTAFQFPLGWLSDKLGGAQVTFWNFIAMTLGVAGVLAFRPQGLLSSGR
mgnify:CR=1 FL=1